VFGLFSIIFVEVDNDKFEYVYNRWKKLLLSKAFGILRDYYLAQDAVSEAFIRIYKNLHKLDDLESGKTAAFMVMIVKNVSITILNKRNRTPDTYMTEPDEQDAFNLEESVISDITSQNITAVIDGLKEELRTPFLLQYGYGFSLKEIGKILKISENNAAVRIHRAKAKLAVMLAKGGYVNGK